MVKASTLISRCLRLVCPHEFAHNCDPHLQYTIPWWVSSCITESDEMLFRWRLSAQRRRNGRAWSMCFGGRLGGTRCYRLGARTGRAGGFGYP